MLARRKFISQAAKAAIATAAGPAATLLARGAPGSADATLPDSYRGVCD